MELMEGDSLKESVEEGDGSCNPAGGVDCDAPVDAETPDVTSDSVMELDVPQLEANLQPLTESTTLTPSTDNLTFDFSHVKLITQSASAPVNSFFKGCKWSPDGSCLLSSSEDQCLRLFDLPAQLYSASNPPELLSQLCPSLQVQEPGLVLDYAWYPFMSSWHPDTACFISSCNNCPIHLWDAFTGALRASYRGYNNVDEVAHAYSVAFNTAGNKILSGYNSEVKIFHVERPGRDSFSINTKVCCGQKGIISCIDNNPSLPQVIAVGSYRKTIGLYTVDGEGVCLLEGQAGGVTQVKFSEDGYVVYSAGRRDPHLLAWDLRSPGTTLLSLTRPHLTHQRIYFDLSSQQHLLSGSTDGNIRLWNISSCTSAKPEPDACFTAHTDCCNGVSLHPKLPLLATASGQRHFPEVVSDEEDPQVFEVSKRKPGIENNIKLWWVGQ